MFLTTIDKESCKGCYLCIPVCPKRLIKLGSEINKRGYHPAIITDTGECTGCRACFRMCPDLAIEIAKVV
ncbi:MAG: 4Fe-4S binding protein [Clostridia bacterium]|nr:4Fe-4S binding protein [Clostridia bacterium]